MEPVSSFTQIRKGLNQGNISCSGIIDSFLDRINQNVHLNAFSEVFEEEAREQARSVDKKISAGTAGKLAGLIIGIKDNLCYKHHISQASSKILKNFKSVYTATVIQKLLDEDAIIIGRQNCDEFGMGSSSENSVYGPVKNALDIKRSAGGSSGGSAVSIQKDLCHISVGTDTGGSVRQPASFCGVIGLKPTYGLLSRYGLIAYASSFDCIGLLGNEIEDIALCLSIMSGQDENDSTSSSLKVNVSYTHPTGKNSYKIAYIRDSLNNNSIQEDVRNNTLRALEMLKGDGNIIEEIDFPYLDHLLPAYYVLTMAEASSNLSRYDGVKYGYRSGNFSDLESMYKMTRSEGFGEEVRKRILIGTFVLSADYYDAYYIKAQKVRNLLKQKTLELFKDYDFIMTPTSPTTAFKLNKYRDDPLEMYFADLMTVQASLTGIPAISVPNGHDQEGLPIGIQVMGNEFCEKELLSFTGYFKMLKNEEEIE